MTARFGFRTLVATIVATLFMAVLVSTSSEADETGHSISGTVHLAAGVNPNVMQVVQVTVTGTTTAAQYATPASDGAYSLTGLPADTYTVHFEATGDYFDGTGYVPPGVLGGWYNDQPEWGTATSVDLTATDATGIDFTFTKALSISGTVNLGAGTSESWLGGVKAYAWGDHGSGTTTVDPATGAYTIRGLAPGSYTLYFEAKPFNDGTSDVFPNLLSEYYNNAAVQADAAPVAITTIGVTDVDVTLERGYSISGHITLPDGSPSAMYNAVTVVADSTAGTATVQPNSAGEYAFYGLAPGSYMVHFDVSYYYDPASGDPVTPDLLPEYYDDSAYIDNATPVVIGAADMPSIDATLKFGHQFDAPPVPVIVGDPIVGTMLGVIAGSWNPGPSLLAYQWLRNGVEIPGATGGNYTIQTADRSTNITVRLTGSLDGYPDVSVTSLPLAVPPHPFVTAPVPTVSGTLKAGYTLTAKAGTWSPAPTTLTYRWYRGSAAISGATHSTYKLTTADRGAKITVKVTGSLSNYVTTSKTSVAKYVPKVFTRTVTPTITGTAKAGYTLTAHRGTWSPTPTYSYRWYRNGVAISGATKYTYKLTSLDKGKKITVRVTGTRTGYTTVAKTSLSKSIAR